MRRKHDAAIAACLFVLTLASLQFVFGSYMPVMEFREMIEGEYGYAFTHPTPAGKLAYLAFALAPREAGFLYAEALGTLCDTRIPCLNAGLHVLIAVGIALGYMLARCLGAKPSITLAALLCFAVAPPAQTIFTWQSTMLDPLALVMVLAALLTALGAFARPQTSLTLALSAGAILLFTAIALKAKEIAFPLPFVLVLFAWPHAEHAASRIRRLAVITPAAIYGIGYIGIYFHFKQSEPIPARFLDGDRWRNVASVVDLLDFADDPPRQFATAAAVIAICIFIVAAVWAVIEWRRAAAMTGRSGILLLIAGALFTGPALTTQLVFDFYLFVALMFVALGYAVLASAVAERSRVAMIALTVPPIAAAAAYFALAEPSTRTMLTGSRNLQASFPTLAREVQPRSDDRFVFLYVPGTAPGSHKYVFLIGSKQGYWTKKSAFDLWRFVDDAAATPLLQGPPASEAHRFMTGSECPADNWTVCVRYDSEMKLIEIRRR